MKYSVKPVLLVLSVYICLSHSLPTPEVHVDGYKELEEPFYPFQQYIQVRKTHTVEHVPAHDNHGDGYSSSNLQALASGHHYEVPRLREEIQDWKKQEVYEEKGYGDSAFDHDNYRFSGHGNEQYEPSASGSSSNKEPDYQQEASSYSGSSSNGHQRPRYRRPHASLHSPDGSSTKLLDYVASSLHDRDAQAKGIYAARQNIRCPEVIDFNLSSKSMKMGEGWRGGARPRLKRLGPKITCLKNKYFGNEPLPSAIFASPSQRQDFSIDSPSFDKFFNMIRKNVETSSSYQNSDMPAFKR